MKTFTVAKTILTIMQPLPSMHRTTTILELEHRHATPADAVDLRRWCKTTMISERFSLTAYGDENLVY